MGSSVNLSAIGQKLSHEDAQLHRETIADLLGRQRVTFPGAQPVSFARKHFAELEHADYYLCEKTDGIRCLLYLHRFDPPGAEPIEAQFLVDRKNDYYYIPQNAIHLPLKDDLGGCHSGTILDGELVVEHYSDGRGDVLIYFIFDCLCLDGANLTQRHYDIRLGKVGAFVYEPWKVFAERYPDDAAHQPFQLRLKTMQSSYHAEGMLRDTIPKLRHGNDGLIFTCKSTAYVPGTDQHILKWKPPHENTVDFRLQLGAFPSVRDEDGEYEDYDGKPEMELLVNGHKGDEPFAMLSVTDSEWEAFKAVSAATQRLLDHRIVECYRDAATGNWRPKMEHHDGTPRFRDDKKEANHITTVESVLESIEDAVTEQDLIKHAQSIKVAWKARERAIAQRRDEEKRKAAMMAQMKSRQQNEAQARAKSQAEQNAKAAYDDAPGYD